MTASIAERMEAAQEQLRQLRAESYRQRQLERREELIRTRTLLVLEDEPENEPWRACPECGEPVWAFILQTGGEVLRCRSGHRVSKWLVMPALQ